MLRFLGAFFVIIASVQVASAQPGKLDGLDDYIVKSMQVWKMPGMAVAIVKDDVVVHSKGYGVRKLGLAGPVDDETMFAVASISKPMTAALLAMLVDEGKISWDDPVSKHLPALQMYDAHVDHDLRIRDLLCHRSGLKRHDLLWYGAPWDRAELLRRIRLIQPSWGFRSQYGYQNLMYLGAGQVIPAVTGKSWDESMRERIFTPLGMKTSVTSVTLLSKLPNVATPHEVIDHDVQVVPYRNIDNMAPAGGVNSNVKEMTQWIRLQLGNGEFEKKRLISAKSMKEMHNPQIPMNLDEDVQKTYPHNHFATYGLGWTIADYRGRKVISHGGSLDGMIAHLAFVPEEKLGFVILTNLRPNMLAAAIRHRILDAYLGEAPTDWSAYYKKLQEEQDNKRDAKERKQEKERVTGTRPSLALEKYAGTYRDELYGEAKVTCVKDQLRVDFRGTLTSDMEHWHYDTFRVRLLEKGNPRDVKALATFRLDENGAVAELRINMEMGDVVAKKQ